MKKFRKLVAIEPVSLVPEAENELGQYAEEVVLYPDIPADDAEIIRRIGDADGVLVSYTSRISGEVIQSCPSIRYIGMCCSLYSEESANVDIACARSLGIQVLGIRDYGDRGVVEYVLHQLIGLLHGFGRPGVLCKYICRQDKPGICAVKPESFSKYPDIFSGLRVWDLVKPAGFCYNNSKCL